jgi:hypothetical protein
LTEQAVRFIRYLWAAPCTLAGLMLIAPAFLVGAFARRVDGVIEIAAPAAMQGSRWLESLPFNAITLGHMVFATSVMELERLRAHEHAHVRQYEQWGIFFLLAYPAASVWQWLRGRRAYVDNWFEVQARRTAGQDPPAA